MDADSWETGAEEAEHAQTCVTFMLAGQIFAVPVWHVREILDRMAITALPNAPADCFGVIDVRGRTVPITDMARRLDLTAEEPGPDTRIIVFEIAGGRPVGVLADRVLNVTEIADSAIEAAPPMARTGNASLRGLTRIGDDLVVLLDIESVLDNASDPAPAV